LSDYFWQRNIRFDSVITGNLVRHRQTEENLRYKDNIFASEHAVVHSGLNEYSFENIVGQYSKQNPDDFFVRKVHSGNATKADYYSVLQPALLYWSEDRFDQVIESWSDFKSRVDDAREVIHKLAIDGATTMAISSGGAISVFVGAVLGLSAEKIIELNLQMLNTSITRFYFSNNQLKLASFNNVPHLDTNKHRELITYV
jgi:broad specificity phosphatase PhoE